MYKDTPHDTLKRALCAMRTKIKQPIGTPRPFSEKINMVIFRQHGNGRVVTIAKTM